MRWVFRLQKLTLLGLWFLVVVITHRKCVRSLPSFLVLVTKWLRNRSLLHLLLQ